MKKGSAKKEEELGTELEWWAIIDAPFHTRMVGNHAHLLMNVKGAAYTMIRIPISIANMMIILSAAMVLPKTTQASFALIDHPSANFHKTWWNWRFSQTIEWIWKIYESIWLNWRFENLWSKPELNQFPFLRLQWVPQAADSFLLSPPLLLTSLLGWDPSNISW